MYIFRYIATFLPAVRTLSTRSFMHPDREDMYVGYQKRLSHVIFIIFGVFTYCSPRDKVHFWRVHSGKMNFSGVNEKSPPGVLPAYELDRNLEAYPVGGFIIYFFSCICIGLTGFPKANSIKSWISTFLIFISRIPFVIMISGFADLQVVKQLMGITGVVIICTEHGSVFGEL